MTVHRKLTKMLLTMILLVVAAFPGAAFAATGDTVSIDFDSSAKVELTVGQTPKQLKVYATLEGSSSKRDVTAAAVWSSSKTEVVKVLNGLLTPVDSGTAIITATYNNAVATLEVSVAYPYKDLKLTPKNEGSYKLGDSDDTLLVKAEVTGGKTAATVNDVTEDAAWSSSDSKVLTVDDGQLTLVGEGTATVTAKYSGLTATFKATVKLPYSALVLKQKDGKEAKTLELVVGDSAVQLTATSKATADSSEVAITDDVEWSSSSESVATVEDGKITVVGAGKTVIKASYLGVSKSVDVYVRAPYEAILLEPADDQSLFMGESLKIKAEVRNAANSNEWVTGSATWSSDNQLVATVASDGVAGETGVATVTAKAVGTTTIKAEYLGVSKTFKITVYPTVTKPALDKTELEVYTGDSTAAPKVSATKLDGTKQDISPEIEWTSADATIISVEDGKLVAGKAGTVTVTGTVKAGEATTPAAIRGQKVELKVTVQNKVLVLIGPEDPLGLVIGEESPLPQVSAVLENGDELDVTDSIVWTLSGTNAVLKTTDKAKTIKGLVKGSASLKGTYANKTLTVPVTIEQKVVKLTVDPTVLEMNLKTSKTIKVTGTFSNGKTATFSTAMNWVSSNEAVVTVKGATVKAAGEGTATLTGSYQGITATVKVTVVPKLSKLTASETRLALGIGAGKSVTVTALYDTGKTADVTSALTWTSSKATVAKVSANGMITAVGKGTASIKGKLGTKTVTISVTVK